MSLASAIHHASRSATRISPIKLNTRTVSSATTAKVFANTGAAEFVAAAGSVNSIPKLHGLPEVIVTGRANVGKSTLLNAVLGRKALLHTSKKAGRTRALNFFRVGPQPGKLVVVDAPGYGARGRAEWGAVFEHYIQNRKELRRIYILFNAKHPINAFDTQMLEHLSKMLVTDRGTQPFTLQSVITKADCIPSEKAEEVITKMRKDIWGAAPLCLPPIITSAEMNPPFGIDVLRKNIADACALSKA
ncbi:P-loop containing nucleoside triphosphate hydrolase protein [Crucibulum laeve]|uniref:P-loop containing nucleoside triphosphate hydrolase protein n=1 Tax=Crucibulum laeve TaxID=68775 RepID=A0A5C3MEE4_9AGAR|nr:P-loop containing nucleoside triphosphate hydrolase protein [Crucibulum laeve]